MDANRYNSFVLKKKYIYIYILFAKTKRLIVEVTICNICVKFLYSLHITNFLNFLKCRLILLSADLQI